MKNAVKRNIALLSALSAFALPAVGATPGNALVMASNIDAISTFDPAQVAEALTAEILANVCDALVASDPKDPSKYVPALAKKWEASEDGKTLTFELQDNIVFPDGSPAKAGDLVWSMHRVLSQGFGNASALTEFGFSATVGAQSAGLVLPFAKLHPSTATIQAAPDEQTLDATGTKAIVVTGVAYPPLDSPGARFAPGTRLFIHASAVPGMPMLACGATLTPAEIECNPTDDPPTGACKFAPLYVEPDAKGSFSFTIPAGHCISGAVTLELRAEKYVGGDDDLCIGERQVTPDAGLLASVQLTFE